MEDVEAAVLATVAERGDVGFTELANSVDADTGRLFRACLRLEAAGELRRTSPLSFSAAETERRRAGDEATTGSVDAEGGFDWVDDGDLSE